jgi:hypothetical protein
MSETQQEQPKADAGSSFKDSGAAKEVKGMVSQLETMLDEYLVKKAPFSLPDNVKELIVKVMPYLIIIMAVLAIPVILAALSISAVLAPIALLSGAVGGSFGLFGIINTVVAIASLVVELFAVKGLFARTQRGWRLAFYASVISLVGSVLSLNILNGILGAIIGWYFLFQVKDKYTK